MSLAAGSTLGPYVLRESLGAGGMGEVYRATDPRLGRDVAIKVLSAETAGNAEFQARFAREMRAVAALQHPNVIVIHDVGEAPSADGPVRYAVTELLTGESLLVRMRRGPLPWRDAVAIGAQIADGLHAAHARGVVHRDLKPSNLFLTADGRAKILDFGLARRDPTMELGGAALDAQGDAAERTVPGRIMGSFGFMSPEQMTGETVDRRSDLFSLGCVLFEMVSGKRAFSGPPAMVIAALLRDEPPPLRSLVREAPPELEHILQRCLRKAPADRYQSAGDLALALHSLLTVASSPGLVGHVGPATTAGRIAALAVLPFVNTDGDPETEYLCDGVTESIIRDLSRLPRLRVMARATVFRFKGRDVDPQALGAELGVDGVVLGRLVVRHEKLVLRVELVECSTGRCLWSEQYHRDAAGLVQLEEDIASQISDQLRFEITGEAPRRRITGDAEAYRLYLRGRFQWNRRDDEGLQRARDFFAQAIAQDPGFGLAHAGLADAYNVLPFWGLMSPKAAFPRAQHAARRALELDPLLAEPHASLGYAAFYYDWDWTGAEASFRRALELDPAYATGHHWYGICLALTGHASRALDQMAEARELDPLSPIIRADTALALLLCGKPREALEQCREVLETDPDFTPAFLYRGLAHGALGDHVDGLAALERAMRRMGENAWLIAACGHAYAVAGQAEHARMLLDRLSLLGARRYVSPYAIALLWAGLGGLDDAFEWLRRGVENRCETMTWLRRDPRAEELRTDARYAGILAALGDVGTETRIGPAEGQVRDR
jgi:serine/threonine-protein kinase